MTTNDPVFIDASDLLAGDVWCKPGGRYEVLEVIPKTSANRRGELMVKIARGGFTYYSETFTSARVIIEARRVMPPMVLCIHCDKIALHDTRSDDPRDPSCDTCFEIHYERCLYCGFVTTKPEPCTCYESVYGACDQDEVGQ